VPDNEFSDENSPEKEDAVRMALGVEKRFEVFVSAPTTGVVDMKGIVVKAIDEDDARDKAMTLIMEGGVDDDNCEVEENEHNYNFDYDTNNWTAKAHAED